MSKLSLTASLLQSGTLAPELKIPLGANSIGIVTSRRNSIGLFDIILPQSVNMDNVFVFINSIISIENGQFTNAYKMTSDEGEKLIRIETIDGGANADGLLQDTPIKIEVYN